MSNGRQNPWVTGFFQKLVGRKSTLQRFLNNGHFYRRQRSVVRADIVLGTEFLESRLPLAANFLSFNVIDASGDDSAQTVFELSALSLNYDLDVTTGSLLSVDLYARENNSLLKLGEFTDSHATDQLINLDGYSTLSGTQEIFAIAQTSDGISTLSSPIFLEVLPTTSVTGDYTAETFHFTGSMDSATVYYGSGGTDTLSVGVDESLIASFNGAALSSYAVNSMVTAQAIYGGSAFDYLRLTDGREIYFQGIERLEFSRAGGQVVTELQTSTNDPRLSEQWNLTIGDVPDAWRFTRGSQEILLVSLDTGIPASGGNHTFSDLDSHRLSFSGNANGGSEHGHQAVSVLAATPNNNEGIAGINWESPVLAFDVYGPGNMGLNTAITTALNRLDSTSETRVVFQGGVQGEFWLNMLQQSLIMSNQDRALFAVAAGNGSLDISLTSDPDDPSNDLTGGVARLEGIYENVMAIGALQHSFDFAGGLENASNVFLANYSNFGPNLTFAVPTDVPAQRPDGSSGYFNGTSAANPVMAGYASLVWSANPGLEAGEVREILAETVTDLGESGRDSTYGHGVPNAGAAVRRAWALAEHPDLAGISSNPLAGVSTSDFNRDDFVTGLDLMVWQAGYGENADADADADGDSDGADFLAWQRSFQALMTTNLIDDAAGNGGLLTTTVAVAAVNVAEELSGGNLRQTPTHDVANSSDNQVFLSAQLAVVQPQTLLSQTVKEAHRAEEVFGASQEQSLEAILTVTNLDASDYKLLAEAAVKFSSESLNVSEEIEQGSIMEPFELAFKSLV